MEKENEQSSILSKVLVLSVIFPCKLLLLLLPFAAVADVVNIVFLLLSKINILAIFYAHSISHVYICSRQAINDSVNPLFIGLGQYLRFASLLESSIYVLFSIFFSFSVSLLLLLQHSKQRVGSMGVYVF